MMMVYIRWFGACRNRGDRHSITLQYGAAIAMVVHLLFGTSDLRAQQVATQIPANDTVMPPVMTKGACRLLAPVAFQMDPTERKPEAKTVLQTELELILPPKDHFFRLESEQAFRDRLRREMPKVKNVQFPKDVPFVPPAKSVEEFPSQGLGPISEPICYRPLYFEDKSTERFGQYVPCLQPLVSTGKFFVGVLIFPCRLIATPPWSFECDNR